MPTIYGILPSPPTRSTLWTAKLVGLDYTLHEVNMLKQENKAESYLKINPAHTIPTFVEDDGYTVIDSHSIVTYIVDQYAKNDSLYPKDLKKRALVNSMLHFDNGSLFPPIFGHFVTTKLMGKPNDPEREAMIKDKLTTLNTFLGLRPYVAGEHVTVADLCIINTLSALKTFGMTEANNWTSNYPNIAKWQEKLKAEVEFYDEIVVKGTLALSEFTPKMAEAYKELMAKKQNVFV